MLPSKVLVRNRKLELLAPAKDADIAIEAIKHGADAIYMGPPSHGARKFASNSLQDISRVVDYAHIYGVRVYITVNTIVYDYEIPIVEEMIWNLWRIGVDALIVQDMGILRMNIPPIELHASTQCDIRTPEKAKFLESVGFSQLVLARELSIGEINDICRAVTIPVETFVHGALCTGYSGRCQAGQACAGRSGNRGECPQICRLPFTLRDARGKELAANKYLLSLKDFNAFQQLESLIEAGVTSFKIEGRLKDMGYVKNVVGAYSKRLNEIIEAENSSVAVRGCLYRSSYGSTTLKFSPTLNKSFNRGFTTYRLSGEIDPKGIASIDTPKSKGEIITNIQSLNPGDGISWFNSKGEYEGTIVNGVRNGNIVGNKPIRIPKGVEIYRTSDNQWKRSMASETANRKLSLEIKMDAEGISASDETGCFVRIPISRQPEKAEKPQDYGRILSKLGDTPFYAAKFECPFNDKFYPASYLSELKRDLIQQLLYAKKTSYPLRLRRKENRSVKYPTDCLISSDNVSNRLAEEFYREHGVKVIAPALETQPAGSSTNTVVMTSKHCILREMGICLKHGRGNLRLPLSIENGNLKFQIHTDCNKCEMQLIKKG